MREAPARGISATARAAFEAILAIDKLADPVQKLPAGMHGNDNHP